MTRYCTRCNINEANESDRYCTTCRSEMQAKSNKRKYQREQAKENFQTWLSNAREEQTKLETLIKLSPTTRETLAYIELTNTIMKQVEMVVESWRPWDVELAFE